MSARRTTTPIRTVLLWGPVVFYMAVIFLLSASSSPPAPPGVSDKLQHAAAYAVLAVLVFRAVSGGLPARPTRSAVFATLSITIGYGITDELHQMFVPLRSPELYDVYADAAGAIVGLIACWAWFILAIPNPQSQIPNPEKRQH